jgi:hypothetical protein
MKKLMITIAVCIGVLSARAGYLPSELTIRMYDYSVISVIFDDQVFDQFNTTYTVSNISAGTHYLKVLRYRTDQFGNTYNFPKMVFSGYITIGAGKVISSMIGLDNRFTVLSEVAVMPVYNNYNNNYSGHYNPHNNGHDHGNHYGNYNNNNNYNYSSYPVCMNDYDFMELKTMVGNTTFDDTKLTICKQAINANNVTSNQVYELMTLITFESNKLELAKFAYGHVIDKNRFYVVNNAFTFSSSIDELSDFISGH